MRASEAAGNQLSDLDRGLSAARRFEWAEAFKALSVADRSSSLGPDDLRVLATAAYLVDRVPDCVTALRRAAEAHIEAGQPRQAARAVFWIVFALGNQGDLAQASGWLARATHLLESQPPDCAEQGLVLGAMARRHMATGDVAQALDLAARAAEIGRLAADADGRGLALTQYASALVKLGRIDEAMALLDEAMVAVVSDEISPIAAGTVYCTMISICGELAELRRAREWTEALDAWCGLQRDMVAFTGQCLVHRAELLHLHGRWPEAIAEAERACERVTRSPDAIATGAARYRQAEIHRVRGDLAAAERAYRHASECGYEPSPGLALVRLAQGDAGVAQATMRRALGETTDPLRRARLLPAQVEIALAAGELPAARRATDELAETAGRYGTPALRASAAYAKGAVLLAEGGPASALAALRTASVLWRDLDVPYEAARARLLMAVACRELGDEETALLELDAATQMFDRLGAGPDLARARALRSRQTARSHDLTAREMQVLRLVATGKTNHAIATELRLSEKTVERHLSNLFSKIGVSSRAAATAFAYQHRLIQP